jgi:hypothetical protein
VPARNALHYDNQSIFKERLHLDKAITNLIHDEITVIDQVVPAGSIANSTSTGPAFERLAPLDRHLERQ